MPEHCPNDGGFIGDAGCTHPNHHHSERTEKILAEKAPRIISVEDCDHILSEGFYVSNTEGKRVGFGKRLKNHLEEHSPKDVAKRKQILPYAVDTVKSATPQTKHRGYDGRTAYAKGYDGFGVLVLADESGDIEQVFSTIRKRKMKLR